MPNKLVAQLPNVLTLSNLFLGCLTLDQIYQGQWQMVAMLVLLAAMVDFFDGFLARLLHAHSAIGKDLDSLADCVTFGVVPGFVIFMHLQQATHQSWLPFLAFIVPVFSALRLAKFNHDTRQSDCFYGLPTPANGLFIVFLPLAFAHFSWLNSLAESALFWIGLTLWQSFMLISPWRLQAFKFKKFDFVSNWPRYLIMVLSLPLLAIFSYFAVPFVVIIYILVSLISNIFQPHEVQS
jgi:CDP-diacylglycerol--serine O-phosphatidyltransferase